MSAFVARLTAANTFEKGLVLPREGTNSVVCTDGIHSPGTSPSQFAAIAAATDKRAKYFGRYEAWQSAACASKAWTARDEDAYRGPFNRRTAAPILVVGNTWDPSTPYEGAVKVASLLPNSRLLSSDNWGHVAYLYAPCVRSAIDTYLLTQAVPARGTICHGNAQPFSDDLTAP